MCESVWRGAHHCVQDEPPRYLMGDGRAETGEEICLQPSRLQQPAFEDAWVPKQGSSMTCQSRLQKALLLFFLEDGREQEGRGSSSPKGLAKRTSPKAQAPGRR